MIRRKAPPGMVAGARVRSPPNLRGKAKIAGGVPGRNVARRVGPKRGPIAGRNCRRDRGRAFPTRRGSKPLLDPRPETPVLEVEMRPAAGRPERELKARGRLAWSSCRR